MVNKIAAGVCLVFWLAVICNVWGISDYVVNHTTTRSIVIIMLWLLVCHLANREIIDEIKKKVGMN